MLNPTTINATKIKNKKASRLWNFIHITSIFNLKNLVLSR